MSHFSVYVFTKPNGAGVGDLLAPYDENLVYAPYIRYTKKQAIEKVRKEIEEYRNGTYAKYLSNPDKYKANCTNDKHIKYLEKEFSKKLEWTDEECYQDEAQWYPSDMIDEEGNLYYTYNPNSKWDWYEIGGRWEGSLATVEGKNTNSDYVKEINWDKTPIPFAYITPGGFWKERGEMGWWAMVSNEKDKDVWETEFKNFVKTMGDDVIVTVVDCHI